MGGKRRTLAERIVVLRAALEAARRAHERSGRRIQWFVAQLRALEAQAKDAVEVSNGGG